MIQKLTKYQTKDGSLFDTEAEAIKHEEGVSESEKLYKFIDSMQDKLIYTRIDECELHSWLTENAKEVREVLEYWEVLNEN